MASAVGELLIKLTADVGGLAQGAKQAVSSLGQIDEATKKTVREATMTRRVLERMVAGSVIMSEAQRVGAALQQLGGDAGKFGSAISGAGQLLQGFFMGGPLGLAIAGAGLAINGLVEAYQGVQQAAKEASEAAAAGHKAAADAIRQQREEVEKLNRQLQVRSMSVGGAMSEAMASSSMDVNDRQAQFDMASSAYNRLAGRVDTMSVDRDGVEAVGAFLQQVENAKERMEGFSAALELAKKNQEVLATREADQLRASGIQSGVAAAGRMATEGNFGGAAAKLKAMWAAVAELPEDLGKGLATSISEARDALKDARDATERSAAATRREYEERERLRTSLAAIAKGSAGQLGIDENTNDPHNKWVLKQGGAARAMADQMREMDALRAEAANAVEGRAYLDDVRKKEMESLGLTVDEMSALPTEIRKLVTAARDAAANVDKGGSADDAADAHQKAAEALSQYTDETRDLSAKMHKWSTDLNGSIMGMINAFATIGKGDMSIGGVVTSAGDRLKSAAGGVATGLANAMGGAAKNMADGIAQGAQAGPWGAVIGAIVGLVTSSKTGAAMLHLLGDSVQHLADSVGSLLKPVVPFIAMITKMSDILNNGITAFLGFFAMEPAIKILFDAVKVVGGAIAAVGAGIAWVITWAKNQFYSAVANILSLIPGMDDEVKSLRAQIVQQGKFTDAVSAAYHQIADLDFNGLENLGDAADKVAGSLLNLPDGFKVAAETFAAQDVGNTGNNGATGTAHTRSLSMNMGGAGPTHTLASGSGEQYGDIINVEITGPVTIVTPNPDDFLDQLERRSGVRRFQRTGNSSGDRPRYLSPVTP